MGATIDESQEKKSGIRPIVLIISILILVSYSIIQTYFFRQNISSIHVDDQSSYIIDVFYYMEIGERVWLSQVGGISDIIYLSNQYSPNIDSRGIVYINSILHYFFRSQSAVAIANTLIFISIFYVASGRNFSSKSLLFSIFLCGLAPYILLPSKESYMAMGYILIIHGLRRTYGWSWVGLGLLLLFVARPQSAGIASLALLFAVAKDKRQIMLLMLMCAGIYFFLREDLKSSSMLVEYQSESRLEGFSCSYLGINVCLQNSIYEISVIKRFFFLIITPLKWPFDLVSSLIQVDAIQIFIKISLVIAAFNLLIMVFRRSLLFSDLQSKFALIFSVLYIFGYAMYAFYQPSRQVATAIYFLLTVPLFRNLVDNRSGRS